MKELDFEFDWEEPQGAQGPELRATWARLRICVKGQPVTRVFHSGLNSVRDSIYLPLYPLVEWITANWWALLNETPPRAGFRERHNFRYGREGFAFPDLQILPLDSTVLFQWKSRGAPDWPVRFLESGNAYVSVSTVERELRRVVDACVERLESQGIQDSFLQEEWARIEDLDGEEIVFCRAAAALGLDPFSVTEEQERLLGEAHRQLGGRHRLEREFLHAAQLGRMEKQLAALDRVERHLRAMEVNGFRATGALSVDSPGPPWQQGYELARALRERWKLEKRRFGGLDDLVSILSKGPGSELIKDDVDSAELFDAVVRTSPTGSPVFALDESKQRPESQSFAFCRALGEWLWHRNGDSAELGLITHSQSEAQRRNRAFAAEFLAPADLIAQGLSGEAAGPEELEELAQEFCVSTWVIEHQLENHGLVGEILPLAV